jgi:hypothetical protein
VAVGFFMDFSLLMLTTSASEAMKTRAQTTESACQKAVKITETSDMHVDTFLLGFVQTTSAPRCAALATPPV